MTRLVEFPVSSGGSVLVEVTERAGGAVTRGLGDAGVFKRAQDTFEQAIARVQPAMESIIEQIRSVPEAPDEVRIEFGLSFHAEAGAFIAAANTTATFGVRLSWRRIG